MLNKQLKLNSSMVKRWRTRRCPAYLASQEVVKGTRKFFSKESLERESRQWLCPPKQLYYLESKRLTHQCSFQQTRYIFWRNVTWPSKCILLSRFRTSNQKALSTLNDRSGFQSFDSFLLTIRLRIVSKKDGLLPTM